MSLMRVEGWDRASERRFLDISMKGVDTAGRFMEVLKGLTAVAQVVIISSDSKESGARPYQELIWEIPIYYTAA